VEVLRRLLEPCQYLATRYTERLVEAGIEPSVGSVGDSFDNALAETVIGLFKTEVIRRRGPWRSIDDVEFAALEWVDWFNHRRLLEPIGMIPPAEHEAGLRPSDRSRGSAARAPQSLRSTRRGSSSRSGWQRSRCPAPRRVGTWPRSRPACGWSALRAARAAPWEPSPSGSAAAVATMTMMLDSAAALRSNGSEHVKS
jgi:hypothetical protein